MAFLACTLHVCLRQRLQAVAGGLTSRAVLEKFCAVQMIDVHLPTRRRAHRHPDPAHPAGKKRQVLRAQLHLTLPAQPSAQDQRRRCLGRVVV